MRAFWTALAILAALMAHTALSTLWPAQARIFDPFLIVVVYCGLTGGETHGMLAGAVAGWVQDVHFGGRVLGLGGLTKVLVGFGVGLSSTRFHLSELQGRVVVLLAATLADALLFTALASVFEVAAYQLSPLGLVLRAAVNSLAGIVLYEAVERQARRFRPSS